METVIKNEKVAPSRRKKEKGEPKLYEAMFLFDSADAAADWDGVVAVVTNILARADAEIVSLRKWDERKLAYEIKGKGKGVYILCYFKAVGGKLQDIERDIQLSERIVRALVLCAEGREAEATQTETVPHVADETGASEPAVEDDGRGQDEKEAEEQG
ncbi:MAG: 30S ribosomal protein S6 [Phycisphaerae bacterium]|nr:30S ribosomal protein S6 [Phycisphaerae bacterium]